MRLVAESPTGWDVTPRRALTQCASVERRRVPRTFWGSNEPRADAVAPWGAMGLYLIQMGVWCASATDAQPRKRKTGCAWRDDRESSDASTRQRFRAPLDKGPVNGCPLWCLLNGSYWESQCVPAPVSRETSTPASPPGSAAPCGGDRGVARSSRASTPGQRVAERFPAS